jgi:type I restriction enzyme S subunit
MRKAVYPLAQGISRFNISKKNILKLDINIPKKTEQVAIYRSLKLIEDIIAIQQQKLTKINEIKKSLLQQMFI